MITSKCRVIRLFMKDPSDIQHILLKYVSRYPRTCLRNEECLAGRVGDILTVEEQCELNGFTFNAAIYTRNPVSISKSIICYY